MIFKVVNADNVSQQAWDSFIKIHRQSTVLHTQKMYAILQSVCGYEPYALFCLDNVGGIQAMLLGYLHTPISGLGSFLSRRSVIPQSPLYSTASDLTALLAVYEKFIKRKAIYTEIRNHIIDDSVAEVFFAQGFKFEEHLNFIVDCSMPEAAWKKISESKRRQIKKAQKQGVNIIEDPTEEQVRSFYLILKKIYAEKIKKPLAPYEYFLNLHKAGSDEYGCKFLLVEYQAEIIGGMVALISGTRVIHEHYIAGLDVEYKEQYPSVMATWAAIDYACRNGISTFDFMGAGSPEKDYGVREFKEKFGGELVKPGRFQKIHAKLKYQIAMKGFEVYQKLGLSK